MKSKIKFAHLYVFTLISVAVILWVAFLPSFYANVDEHNYARSAWKLAHGESLLEKDPLQNLGGFANDDNQYVSKYNLGNSIWLAPFTTVNFEFTFAAALITYLLIVLVCTVILKELELSFWWLALIIFFPPFIYFSRTLFSEMPAALMLTISYLAFLKRQNRWWLVVLGASLGMAVLIRYNLALWVLLITATIAWEDRKKYKKLLTNTGIIALSALPFLLIFLITNHTLYGSFLSSGYRFSGEESLHIDQIITRLPWYLFILNVIYPLQFILTGFSKKPLAKQVVAFNVITILFYSVAGGFLFEKQLTDTIVGIRFFIPVLPLVLIHYIVVLDSILPKKLSQVSIFIGTPALILLAFAIHNSHQDFINERREKYEMISPQVKSGTVIIGGAEDYIYLGEHLNPAFNDSGYLDAQAFTLDPREIQDQLLLLEIGYRSREDRPVRSVIKLRSENKIKLIDQGADKSQRGKLKIYELEK